MSTLAIKFDDHAVDVSFTKTSLHFVLADGREISAPLSGFQSYEMQMTLNEKTGVLLVMALASIGLRLMKIFQ